jgi:hypothetical protein
MLELLVVFMALAAFGVLIALPLLLLKGLFSLLLFVVLLPIRLVGGLLAVAGAVLGAFLKVVFGGIGLILALVFGGLLLFVALPLLPLLLLGLAIGLVVKLLLVPVAAVC